MISSSFGQPFFDFTADMQFPEAVLRKEKELSRYYAWANSLRGLVYFPVLKGLYGTGHWFSFGIISLLVVFHLACVMGEFFKMGSLAIMIANQQFSNDMLAEPEPPDLTPPKIHWYFTPFRIESEKLYKAIGFDSVKNLVTWYTDHTQLTREERMAGKKTKHMEPTLAGMIDYEKDTRQAEVMHLAAASMNLPPFVSFLFLDRWWLAGWVGFVLSIDSILVFLQRYHRTRVMSRLQRVLDHRGLTNEPRTT